MRGEREVPENLDTAINIVLDPSIYLSKHISVQIAVINYTKFYNYEDIILTRLLNYPYLCNTMHIILNSLNKPSFFKDQVLNSAFLLPFEFMSIFYIR